MEGFSAIFHCPCASPSCAHHDWQVNEATPNSDFIKNSTHLTFPNVSRAYLGWCVTCLRQESGSYLLYNITEVKALGRWYSMPLDMIHMCGMTLCQL